MFAVFYNSHDKLKIYALNGPYHNFKDTLKWIMLFQETIQFYKNK